jgi:hypothetical protein
MTQFRDENSLRLRRTSSLKNARDWPTRPGHGWLTPVESMSYSSVKNPKAAAVSPRNTRVILELEPEPTPARKLMLVAKRDRGTLARSGDYTKTEATNGTALA